MVDTEEAFEDALNYIAEKVGDLANRLLGERLPVPILKFFAHSDEEYQILETIVGHYGPKAKVSSGNSFYVEVNNGLVVANTPISLLGVRRPDMSRPQVGCGDYIVENFDEFTSKLHSEQPQFTQFVENAHGSKMLELRHPDFDVLGYVIKPK